MTGAHLERAMLVPGLTMTERLVLLKLAQYANRDHQTHLSSARIAAEIGAGTSTVFRSLDALEGAGLVTREATAELKVTLYTLHLTTPTVAQTTPTVADAYPTVGHSSKSTSSTTRATYPHSSDRTNRPEGRSNRKTPNRRHLPSVFVTAWPNQIQSMLAVESEGDMPMPGFEDETPVVDERRQRWQGVDDSAGLRGVGALDDDGGTQPKAEPRTKPKATTEPRLPRYKTTPVEKWNGQDFYGYLTERVFSAGPVAKGMINAGWAKGDFASWLAEGIDPSLLKTSIDDFTSDRSRRMAGNVWRTYRSFYLTKYAVVHRPEATVEQASEQAAEDAAANAAAAARLMGLLNV